MRDIVIHSQSGLLLDFAEEDFGGDEQAVVIASWRERHHTEQGEFLCHDHRNHERPWLYLQQRGGLLVAAHWPGTGLAGSHEITHGISDEHKREVEYIQRAETAAGFESRTEVALPTKVRPDLLVYGPHQIGVEVQRSQLTATAAKARTTKARQAGVESLWFSDNRRDPPWLWQVPGVRMMDLPWDELPPSGFVKVVSGVRSIVPERCRSIRNSTCPEHRYGCNRWHPDHGPYPVLVDDLAAAVPQGFVVPILWRPFGGRGRIILVRALDKARYEAMTGRPADIPLRQRERPEPQQAERILCAADAGGIVAQKVDAPAISPTRCAKDNTFLLQLVPGKLYCPTCHRREMNARGLSNYPIPV